MESAAPSVRRDAGICLSRSRRKQVERDVYVASSWHPDSESGLRKTHGQEIAHGERPEGRAPAQILASCGAKLLPDVEQSDRILDSDRDTSPFPTDIATTKEESILSIDLKITRLRNGICSFS